MADHVMTDQSIEPGAPSALQQWNAAVQALLDRGYSTLNAYDVAHKAHPGLWGEAVAEHAAQAVRKKAGR
jgi:hypothetical protein